MARDEKVDPKFNNYLIASSDKECGSCINLGDKGIVCKKLNCTGVYNTLRFHGMRLPCTDKLLIRQLFEGQLVATDRAPCREFIVVDNVQYRCSLRKGHNTVLHADVIVGGKTAICVWQTEVSK